jgi:hypothetical protein
MRQENLKKCAKTVQDVGRHIGCIKKRIQEIIIFQGFSFSVRLNDNLKILIM